MIDNIGRGIIWTRVSSIGIFISSIEWITFLALNNRGSDWKSKLSSSNDLIVRNVMKNDTVWILNNCPWHAWFANHHLYHETSSFILCVLLFIV
ncbi:unnamed protein product [Rotaria sp. Silwood1]|nr:unnamed protein product [Rotaria sp. Silwood1]CAF3682315.1 unnamed protein product [Rotaria sp. Silwood1]